MTPTRPPDPVFIAGRQHSGNTMLAAALGRLPGVLGCLEEGNYFERRRAIAARPPQDRVAAVVQRLRKDGAPVPEPTKLLLSTSLTKLVETGASTDDLYRQGMRLILDVEGCTRWVQKATSYVFHADSILAVFPGAHIVFLARNPLDIAASLRQRGYPNDLFRMAWGWRVGLRRAIALQHRHPTRFRIVRYEDLVRGPEAVVRGVCEFAGLPYTSEALRVAHVNRAEDKYALTSERQGFTASRVFHYGGTIGRGEESAVRRLVGGLLDELYPELTQTTSRGVVELEGIARLGSGALYLAASQIRRMAKQPKEVARRTWRRLAR